MNKKNLLEKLISVFNSEKETEVELNFIDVKTIDGRILRVEDMDIEKVVKEITAEGEIDLEDGEYTLEDGLIIKVEGGLIKEISEVKEEVVEEEQEVVEEEMTEEVIEEDLEVNDLIDNIKTLIEEVKSLKEGFTLLKEENEGLKLEVEKFSKLPSTEPTKLKVDFKKENKNDSIMYNILTNKQK
jgi:hypothetical protein